MAYWRQYAPFFIFCFFGSTRIRPSRRLWCFGGVEAPLLYSTILSTSGDIWLSLRVFWKGVNQPGMCVFIATAVFWIRPAKSSPYSCHGLAIYLDSQCLSFSFYGMSCSNFPSFWLCRLPMMVPLRSTILRLLPSLAALFGCSMVSLALHRHWSWSLCPLLVPLAWSIVSSWALMLHLWLSDCLYRR